MKKKSSKKKKKQDLNTMRHIDVFDPDAFQYQIHIIGCGATGSRIAMSIAKLGVGDIHVWDFDDVADHNICNQLYGHEHVGMSKVDALHDIISDTTGIDIITHNEKVDGTQSLSGVVYLLTDTMESRKEIWEGALKYHPGIKAVIETRMGTDNGRIYWVDPSNPTHIKKWESTLYDDEVSEESACGTKISVGPTAELVSGLATWTMIRWFEWNKDRSNKDEPEHESIFGLAPPIFLNRKF